MKRESAVRAALPSHPHSSFSSRTDAPVPQPWRRPTHSPRYSQDNRCAGRVIEHVLVVPSCVITTLTTFVPSNVICSRRDLVFAVPPSGVMVTDMLRTTTPALGIVG